MLGTSIATSAIAKILKGMPNFVQNVPWRDLDLFLSFVWFYDGPMATHTVYQIDIDTFSHCINIRGKTPNFWELSWLKATPSFSSGWDFMIGLGKPHQPANFEVAIFSRCRNIKGEPLILGSSPSPGPRPLLLWVWFYDGPWQTKAAYQIWSR